MTAVGCLAALEGVQSLSQGTAWEQEGELGRWHIPTAMPKHHRAPLCWPGPQLKEKVLFHLFWQPHKSLSKPLELSRGCVRWDAQCKKKLVGINSTKILNHE